MSCYEKRTRMRATIISLNSLSMPVKSEPSRRPSIRKQPAPKAAPQPVPAPMIELDEPEALPILEEKTEDELLSADEESDELGLDDAGLEEELDPFNDKWEA